jgi:hypothetical protein
MLKNLLALYGAYQLYVNFGKLDIAGKINKVKEIKDEKLNKLEEIKVAELTKLKELANVQTV